MPNNNFLPFDQPGSNMMTDTEYTSSSDRTNGVKSGIANPRVHNKLFRQLSFMMAALANFIVGKGLDATDADLNILTQNLTTALSQNTTPFMTGFTMINPYLSEPPEGWIYACGTIGNATSGANNRANADTQNLFVAAWNKTASSSDNALLYNSLGVVVPRGASALADFAAGKSIQIVDWRGRAIVGRDNYGGTPAGRITSASLNGAKASQPLGASGEETNRLTIATMPEHDHDENGVAYTSGPIANGSGNGRFTTKTGKTGGGQPHNNMPPYQVTDIFIKL